MTNYRYIVFLFLVMALAGPIVGRPVSSLAAGAPEIQSPEDFQITAPFEINALKPFFQALNDLETGKRTDPVLIIMLGDSHMAGGFFSGRLRTLFQERFGDAGRGALPPGMPFKYYYPDQVSVRQSGDWKVHNSFETPNGLYGLSGFRLSSKGKAEMALVCEEEATFDRFGVDYIGRPGGGTMTIRAASGLSVRVSTSDEKSGPRRVAVHTPKAARRLQLSLAGDGPVELISWGVERERPGVIIESHGIIGATAAVTRTWDQGIVAWELAHRKPSLIVLEYGGNEGFNDYLDLEEYRQMLWNQCAFFKKAAPGAGLLLLGPSDCARWPEYCDKKGYRQQRGQCRSLTGQEEALYSVLQKKQDPGLCRWHPPPRLDKVRRIQREVAREGGFGFWDWQKLMKRDCGIQEWVDRDPPLAAGDHVHLTNRGYTISANALFRDLMDYYVYYCTSEKGQK